MEEEIKKRTVDFLQKLLDKGSFFISAIELEHDVDGEDVKVEIEKLVEDIKLTKESILKDLLKAEREIISSPIRFNGVSMEDIKRIFAEHGIKYEHPF